MYLEPIYYNSLWHFISFWIMPYSFDSIRDHYFSDNIEYHLDIVDTYWIIVEILYINLWVVPSFNALHVGFSVVKMLSILVWTIIVSIKIDLLILLEFCLIPFGNVVTGTTGVTWVTLKIILVVLITFCWNWGGGGHILFTINMVVSSFILWLRPCLIHSSSSGLLTLSRLLYFH